MDELELPLTPLEQSRADFGQRFYKIKVGFHNGLFTALNAANGRASGVGTRAVTLREIPLEDDMTLNQDGTHYLLAYQSKGGTINTLRTFSTHAILTLQRLRKPLTTPKNQHPIHYETTTSIARHCRAHIMLQRLRNSNAWILQGGNSC